MDIRQYLIDCARSLTGGAPALPPGERWQAWQKERRERFWEMLGIDAYMKGPRQPPAFEVTKVHPRDGYRIECLYYESLPGLQVEANLYVPDGPGPHPAVLYLCGHSELQKASHYQQHARRYAQLGFVTLIIDTVQLGEVRGYHHGTYRYGWFHWISRGFTPAGVETWNGIRGLDLLAVRPDVDATRLGVTGTSGGGAMTWWIAAADARIRAASPSCATSTIASHIEHRTIDGHCDCMFPVNLYGWSLVDMGALVAPRPLLIVSADRDALFHADGIREFYARLAQVYRSLGALDNLELFTFRAPHSYRPESRRKTFQWFVRKLQGEDVPWTQVDDVDGHTEAFETLRVYEMGPPRNNKATTVHDWFVPQAPPPRIDGPEALEIERLRVVDRLRETSFSAFPDPAPEPEFRRRQEWLDEAGNRYTAFTYASEREWRLGGTLMLPNDAPGDAPLAVELLHPDDMAWLAAYRWTPGLPRRWRRAVVETRGTGTAGWPSGLSWHVRRALALTGRTVASLRIFDTLQALRALRTVQAVAGSPVYLVARGEMAAVAMYAALLDNTVRGLILFNPPATHNTPGHPDGTGPALELLGVLRVTDLPYVAGLLWPRQLVFAGGRPEQYLWTEELYERLGPPGGWWNVPHLAHWRASSEAEDAGETSRVHTARNRPSVRDGERNGKRRNDG